MNYSTTAAASQAKPARPPRPEHSGPDWLVKEEIGGVKFYYKGYKQVLDKTKTKEEIMGCSGLQSFVIEYLLEILYGSGIRKRYRVFTNETGNTLAHRHNMQFDIALYDKTLLTLEKITRKYVKGIPPAVVVEIDMDVELEGTGVESVEEFVILKSQSLLRYGVKKVVWILTRSKKVLLAEEKSWVIHDWSEDLELVDGVSFNIAAYFEQEGYNPDVA